MKLIYQKSRYTHDNTLAIVTYTKDEGYLEPYGTVTLNVSDYYNLPLTDELIILPKYKMSEEFYNTVIKDIVEKELGELKVGYGIAQMVKLKPNWEDLVETLPPIKD